jgi:large repetitive protein
MPISRRRLLTPVVIAIAALIAFTAVRASAATLSVSTASLPAGEVNVAYSQTLSANGGTGPYTWAVLNPALLPTGISLNSSTGVLSGTPSVATTANFVVQVTDASAGTATRALSIVVHPAVTVGTSSLPVGQVGLSYSQTLSVLGGVAPFSWAVQSGTLPSGLSLNTTTGAITGSPNSPGTSTFTVRVTDALAQHADQALSLTVNAAGTLAITTASLPNGTVGAAYSQTLAATGGTAPYLWALASGSLPPGLTLSTAGVMSGTPATSGSFTFSVLVADNAGGTATRQYTIAVSPLSITTATLPSGSVGSAYSQTIAATGGTGAYVWTVASGGLPTGLTLNASTGLLSGTPTTVGSSTFTVQVADALLATALKTFVLQIKATADEADANVNGNSEKVTICHVPSGNPENEHTITVGEPAVAAHLAHGDSEGACADDAVGTAQGAAGSDDDGNGKGKGPKTNSSRGRGPR